MREALAQLATGCGHRGSCHYSSDRAANHHHQQRRLRARPLARGQVRLHPIFTPGTIGFWRNWRNHYAGSQFQALINDVVMNNSRLDNQDGRTPSSDDLTSAKVDAIFNYGSSTPRDQQILGQFTTVTLNLAITRLQAGSGLTQHNDNLCRGATIDISGIAGAPAFFGIDHLTVGQ